MSNCIDLVTEKGYRVLFGGKDGIYECFKGKKKQSMSELEVSKISNRSKYIFIAEAQINMMLDLYSKDSIYKQMNNNSEQLKEVAKFYFEYDILTKEQYDKII